MKGQNVIDSILNYKKFLLTRTQLSTLLRWNKIIRSKVGETNISQSEIKYNSDIVIDSKYHKNWWLDKNLGEQVKILMQLKKM